MTWTARVAVPLVLVIGLAGGCRTAPTSREGKDELIRRATTALVEWNSDIPGLEGLARQGYGHAMFPRIVKGGLGIGAAYGRGVVYEEGQHIGYADLSHASLGLQAGGQTYQVLVVFDNKTALERFKRGRLDFSADTSGVVLETGYVATVRFIEGITVFSRPIGGVMGEATMGAQRFTFVLREEHDPGNPVRPAAPTP